jgi:C4-dicarboxylate transporter/malic acid transport protein
MANRDVALRPRFCLRCFHPGWFGVVMGTGIVGIALAANPGNWSAMLVPDQYAARVMAAITAVLFVGLGGLYILRWVRSPREALADLRNPLTGAMYATVPAGILVAAIMASAVGPLMFPPAVVYGLVFWLTWVGVPLTFVFSVVFLYVLMTSRGTVMEAVNGSWFIPPVANIVVPVVLAALAAHATPPAMARLLMLTGYAFWGMGLILFLLVLSMLHDRLILHPLPHAAMAPSLVITLGPVGVGALALIKLAAAGAPVFGTLAPSVSLMSLIAASILWGFGLWWMATTLVVMVRYLATGPLPYGLGWWAFTFPVGAFSMATLTLGRAWNIGYVDDLAVGFVGLLILLWLMVAVRTLWATATGEAWAPRPAPAQPPAPAGVHPVIAAGA